MKIVHLKKDMDARFAQVDERFAQIDVRFEQIDARFERIDARFEQIDARFEQIDARFEEVDARFAQIDARFEQIDHRITTEHETSRRHMDVLFEQFKAENRLGLDKISALEQQSNSFHTSNIFEHAAFVEVLKNHEGRLKALEPGDESA